MMHIHTRLFYKIWRWRAFHPKRRSLGCKRRFWGCLTLLVVSLLLACGLLFWAVRTASATDSNTAAPLLVYLLIDNSNSMFDMGGVGSDPELLRIDAARLFISYLGVDDSRVQHECGVIFFGDQAELIAPLTRLDDDGRRAELFALIQQPPRMGWTDQTAALALARDTLALTRTEFERHSGMGQPVAILVSDGKPEWGSQPTVEEREAYLAALRAEGERLAAAGIPLFIILLANEVTDADPEIRELWQPVWREIAEATAPGFFFEARQAEDLIAIYHDIVLALTGGQAAGVVIQADVDTLDDSLRQTVVVEPDLARLTFVVSKSRPDLTVSILLPDGEPLSIELPGVRYAGQPGITREEIWVIDDPPPGDWTALISGSGRVTVWKDYRPAPPPAPTMIVTSPLAVQTAPVTQATQAAQTATPAAVPPLPTLPPSAAPTIAPVLGQTAIVFTTTPETAVNEVDDLEAKTGRSLLALSSSFFAFFILMTLAGIAMRRRRQPYVQGDLRLTNGTGFADGRRLIELDAIRKTRLTVGLPPADIPIASAERRFLLRPGASVGGAAVMRISGPPEILLNGHSLQSEQRLDDNDLIDLGGATIRYENLRLRSAARSLVVGDRVTGR